MVLLSVATITHDPQLMINIFNIMTNIISIIISTILLPLGHGSGISPARSHRLSLPEGIV
jgi:hypothetical protein